jgi:hypothetical protein
MKKYMTCLGFIFLASCTTNKHYFQCADGKWISKKKLDREIHRATRHAIRSMSKEDLELLRGIRFTVDTITIQN